jgi:MFS family permease
MLILLLVIVAMEIVDISINKIYLFISSIEFSSTGNILAFIGVTIVFFIGQYFILNYAGRSIKDLGAKQKSLLSKIHKIPRIIQYTLTAILLLVTLQMIITSHYSTRLLISSTWISYTFSIVMLGVLARQFISWFRSNRNTVVLLYTLAIIFIGIDVGTGIILNTALLMGQPVDSQQIVGSMSANIPDNIIPLNYVFIISSVVSFILTWIATVLVLRHYSNRLGRIRYWILVSSPLLYFLIQFQPFLLFVFFSYSVAAPVSFAIIYTVIFSASKPVGGLLFAAAFWSMARKISSRKLSNYMIICAFGLALIFGSDQAIILVNKPYPPFGLATVSFMGLSSYLLLIGIFSSAISVGEDSRLRQSIRNYAMKESRLLDSIGTAEMQRDIEKRVITLTKQNQDRMAEESGIQSSLTEEDMKQYLEQVIREVQMQKASDNDTGNRDNA